MAYMDVPPSGASNGKSVVLLHGMNFFGEAWTETIEILSKEGYRVIVPDQIGYGRSSKPILHYSISTHASNTKRLHRFASGSRPPTSSRTRWAAWWRAASPRPILMWSGIWR